MVNVLELALPVISFYLEPSMRISIQNRMESAWTSDWQNAFRCRSIWFFTLTMKSIIGLMLSTYATRLRCDIPWDPLRDPLMLHKFSQQQSPWGPSGPQVAVSGLTNRPKRGIYGRSWSLLIASRVTTGIHAANDVKILHRFLLE